MQYDACPVEDLTIGPLFWCVHQHRQAQLVFCLLLRETAKIIRIMVRGHMPCVILALVWSPRTVPSTAVRVN